MLFYIQFLFLSLSATEALRFHFIGKYDYEQANKECYKRGLTLVRADTEKSAKTLSTFVKSISLKDYWIDANYLSKKNVWVHHDGTPAANNLWAPGEPQDLKTEKCVIVNFVFHEWKWWNNECLANKTTICDTEPSVSQEPGFVYLGLYNYTQANKECMKRGFKLVRADSIGFAKALHNFSIRYNLSHYWIDANNLENENVWTHNDGTLAANNLWMKGQPNNMQENRCAIANLVHKGWKWWKYQCSSNASTICEHKFSYIGKYNYTRANKECIKRGLTLVRADTERSAKALYDYVVTITSNYYWVDANNFNYPTSWVHYDGSNAANNLWIFEEPNNLDKEQCGIANWNGYGFKWWNYNCNISAVTICEHSFLYAGEYHYEQANQECFKRGLTLVRADSEVSAKALYDYTVLRSLSYYWIDANNLVNASSWVHHDGTRAPTNLWAPGNPSYINESRCVIASPYNNYWKWQNYPCLLKMDTVCEKRRVYIGEYTYKEANKNCIKIGLTLARADSQEYAKDLYKYASTVSSQPYWIDMKYSVKGRLWTHFDGTPSANHSLVSGIASEIKVGNCTVSNTNKGQNDQTPWKWYHYKCNEKAKTICV